MINIDKLEQIQHDIINSDDDKKEVIELFNRQLSLLDKVTDEFDICYELAKNIDDALSLIQKIWIKTDRKHDVEPIIKSTTNIKKLVKFKSEHIKEALDRLNSPKSLDELKTISSDIISMQLDPTINIILSDINHNHADRLEQEYTLHSLCASIMFNRAARLFFDNYDISTHLLKLNRILADEIHTEVITKHYPSFVSDFQQTKAQLSTHLKDATTLLIEYKDLSEMIYKIYKRYEILK